MSFYLGSSLIGKNEKKNLKNVVSRQALFRYNKQIYNYSGKAEKKICSLLQVSNCLLMSSCTSALKAALISLQPSPGNIVLLPALTFIATANACLSLGLIPKLIDVDDSGHMSPILLKNYLENNNKPFAVLVVHLDGLGADIEKIKALCTSYKIPLIEDVARSFYTKKNILTSALSI